MATHAADKLARKGVDLIVANDVSAPNVGFAHDTNAVSILSVDGTRTEVPLADKRRVAAAVWDEVLAHRSRTQPTTGTPDPPQVLPSNQPHLEEHQ